MSTAIYFVSCVARQPEGFISVINKIPQYFPVPQVLRSMMKCFVAQRPLISALTLFGLFFFRFDGDYSSNWRKKLYCAIVNFFMTYQFVANSNKYISSFSEFLGDGSKVTFYCHFFEALATQFNLLIILYCVVFRKSDQIELFKLLSSVEKELDEMSSTHGEIKKLHRYLWINSWCSIIGAVIFYSALFFIYFLVLLDTESSSHSLQVLYYLALTSFFTFIIDYFLQLVVIIGAFYDAINHRLRTFIGKSDFYLKEVRALMELHQKLTTAILRLNSSFGVVMLGMFLFIFTISSFECYFAYITVYENLVRKSSRYFFYAVTNLFWPVPMLVHLQFLGNSCSKVQDKITDTSKILGTYSHGTKIVEKSFSSLLEVDTRFTANGFFVIDSSISFNVSCIKFLKLKPKVSLNCRSSHRL